MSDVFTILVTGGAGFIGSHLCERLLQDGHTVISVDNFSTSTPKNFASFASHKGFTSITHDITDDVTPLLNFAHIDYVFNLACPASPIQYQKDPLKTISTNVLGTKNMLDMAVHYQAIFVQASTSEVYGDPEVHPQPEQYVGHVNTVGPRACYDEGKRCAETLCYEYARQKRITTKIARIFNTYGPRMAHDDGRVVSNFILQALHSTPITLYGDGLQTRSFQYVSDTVNGLLALAFHPQFHGPVNIGSEFELTMQELATKICTLAHSQSTFVYEPLPKDDPKQRRPDTRLARAELGIEAETSVDSGLLQTIEYFASTIHN
jgi:UDP-glucuronate decarboxylase